MTKQILATSLAVGMIFTTACSASYEPEYKKHESLGKTISNNISEMRNTEQNMISNMEYDMTGSTYNKKAYDNYSSTNYNKMQDKNLQTSLNKVTDNNMATNLNKVTENNIKARKNKVNVNNKVNEYDNAMMQPNTNDYLNNANTAPLAYSTNKMQTDYVPNDLVVNSNTLL